MRRGEFVRLGEVGASAIGLPERLARELELARAWRRVAGEAVARRLVPEGIRRGVLELRVEDPRWLPTARALAPKLAFRMSREAPGLGVKRLRLLAGERREEAPLDDPDPPSR
ncbi:MAG TPA: DciA family protein [Candidatus Polarisedimenticolaceae bacterium]